MKLTPKGKLELSKRIGKKVQVCFGGALFGDGYCGKLLEFNNDTMTFKGLSGIKIIPFKNCNQITLKGEDMYG